MYDVFLSHASEDKESFVRPLANELASRGLLVWYDEISLKPGSSLRKSIDEGLAASRYCIIVLSAAFFAKKWTNWELNGIVQRHLDASETVILPIWYGVDRAAVAAYSAPLADIVAVRADRPITEIAAQLVQIIKPASPDRVKAGSHELSDRERNSAELHALLKDVLTIVSHIVPGVTVASLFVPEGSRMALIASSPELLPAGRHVTVTKRHSVVGHAAETGQAIDVSDVDMSSNPFKDLFVAHASRLRSEIAVPMIDKNDNVVAVMAIESTEAGAFGSATADVVATIIHLAGRSISNLI